MLDIPVEDLWGREGIDEKLTHVGQQSQDNVTEIGELKLENQQLRKDVNLLKSLVIKLDRKVNDQNQEILNLKGRSMRDNILIHSFSEETGEDLMKSVPAAIKEHLNVDVKFIRIHRNSPTPRRDGKPRSITGKLVDLSMKGDILTAQKAKKDENVHLPFHITPQSPPELAERRKQLYELNQKFNTKNIKTRVVGEKLLFPDNTQYRDRVVTPTAEDLLSVDDKEAERLEKIQVVHSQKVVEMGNKFIGHASKVSSVNDVRRFYKRVVGAPEHTEAHHNILVYRFVDREGLVQDGYVDDGEFGAGRKLLKYLTDNKVTNAAFVITRWYSGNHLGPRRFSLMENIVNELSKDM